MSNGNTTLEEKISPDKSRINHREQRILGANLFRAAETSIPKQRRSWEINTAEDAIIRAFLPPDEELQESIYVWYADAKKQDLDRPMLEPEDSHPLMRASRAFAVINEAFRETLVGKKDFRADEKGLPAYAAFLVRALVGPHYGLVTNQMQAKACEWNSSGKVLKNSGLEAAQRQVAGSDKGRYWAGSELEIPLREGPGADSYILTDDVETSIRAMIGTALDADDEDIRALYKKMQGFERNVDFELSVVRKTLEGVYGFSGYAAGKKISRSKAEIQLEKEATLEVLDALTIDSRNRDLLDNIDVYLAGHSEDEQRYVSGRLKDKLVLAHRALHDGFKKVREGKKLPSDAVYTLFEGLRTYAGGFGQKGINFMMKNGNIKKLLSHPALIKEYR